MINLGKKAYTWVSETFAPQAGKDFPVTEQKFVKGGHQNFTSFTMRDNFPMLRKAKYMTCTIKDVSYILMDDLTTWNPFDRGYLILNPKRTREAFYVVLPFHYAVLSVSSVDSVVHTSLVDGLPGQRQMIEITGSEGSVVTFEVARIYVD